MPDNLTLTRRLVGADDLGIVDALSDHLSGQRWTIERQNLPGTKNGYTKPEERLVVLEEDLSPEHAAKTMIHETAHIELGHIGVRGGSVRKFTLRGAGADSGLDGGIVRI